MIFNSYKYDVIGCVKKFLTKKIQLNEIQFRYGEYTHENYLEYLDTLEKKDQKKSYTYLIGNLIKINKEIYREYLHSSIHFLESLMLLNRKLIPDLQIHKSYVDEVIVNHPLVIKHIDNFYNYEVSEDKFNLFVKKLDTLGKQAYFSKLTGIDINHTFNSNNNLITDAANIMMDSLNKADEVKRIHTISLALINKTYPIENLVEIDSKNDVERLMVQSEYGRMPYFKGSSYNNDYYYHIWLELVKYILIL